MMINLVGSRLSLSIPAIYKTLVNKYNAKNLILSSEAWNEFAEFIEYKKVNEPINYNQACTILEEYLNTYGTDACKKICDFLNWSNFEVVNNDLYAAEKILNVAAENQDTIVKISEYFRNNQKIKSTTLGNECFVACIYDSNDNIISVHVSTEKSIHKIKQGNYDFAEVGFYPDRICVNLDSHSEYNDSDGFNDFYDLYIENDEYDYNTYRKLAEKIFYYAD